MVGVAGTKDRPGKPMKKYSPPWDFGFMMDEAVSCAFCLKSEMPMLVRGGQTLGVCEPCSAIVHHLWKQEPGEVPPEFPHSAQTEVARVYLLIPRLAATNKDVVDGKEVHTKAEPTLSNSYEFVMVTNDEGLLDLPGANVAPGGTLWEASVAALKTLKAQTWSHPRFIEPLYTAYTPRGRLAAVMLVTAWRLDDADAIEDGFNWKQWPLSGHPTPMGGFYKALETVWDMRLFRHNREASHTEAISVRVRGAGSNYIKLQQRLRSGAKGLDLSMVDVMRRTMTEDEKKIDKMITEHEALSQELKVQKEKDALTAGEGGSEPTLVERVLVRGPTMRSQRALGLPVEAKEVSTVTTEEAVPNEVGGEGFGEDSGSDEFVDGEADDVIEESVEEKEEAAEQPPLEGFARRGRALTTKGGQE